MLKGNQFVPCIKSIMLEKPKSSVQGFQGIQKRIKNYQRQKVDYD